MQPFNSTQFWIKSDIALSNDEIVHLLNSKQSEMNKRLSDISRIAASEIGPIIDLRPILEGGTFCLLFEATTDGNQSFIIKTSLLPEPCFSGEREINDLLRKSHIPTLSISHIDCSRERYPFDYMIMEKIEGHPLSDAKKQLHLLGKRLAQVHQIKMEGFGISGLKKTWGDHLYSCLDQHIRYCCDNHIIQPAHAQQIENLFSMHESTFSAAAPQLLHGDLGNSNIFVQEESDEIILIDWGDSLNGDPLFDIAMWGTFIGNHEKRHALLEGYQSLTQLPSDFELLYWLYYLRIILAKTVHRHRFQYDKRDKIPALSRILLPLEELSACASC